MSNYETNPVGALQERFQSRGIVPQYNVVQAEGASHDPTFVFQVILGDLTATGTGSSKKQAKYSAARAMLDKLDGRVLTRDDQAPQPPVTDAASKPDAPGNTVRTLEELDVKKDAGWEYDSEGSRTLWVGGINANVDEEILFELFLNSGPLEKVVIPKDKHTLKKKSFGFIIFEHRESVKYAIKQMTGVKLFGNRIRPRRAIKQAISNEVNANYLEVPKVDKNNVTKNQTTNSIKIDFLRLCQTESSNTRCFVDEKDIDLKECDERCLKHPQGFIRRNKIKVNLITLEKSKEITELDNNATNEDLQSSQHVDSQIMKAVSNELQIKSINNNIAENIGQEEPGAWMKNIKSPQKVCVSPEKLGSYLKNDHQNELRRDLEMRRFPENERGRSQERRSSRESQSKNQQHGKIFESDIDDLLNNCRKDVDFGRRSEDSKNNSRKSEMSRSGRSRSRRRSTKRHGRERDRSTKRHGRERERDQSNYDKRNASMTFIGKGKE